MKIETYTTWQNEKRWRVVSDGIQVDCINSEQEAKDIVASMITNDKKNLLIKSLQVAIDRESFETAAEICIELAAVQNAKILCSQ